MELWTSIYQPPMAPIVAFFKQMLLPTFCPQMKKKCNSGDKKIIFLTACEPHLQRTVLCCWQHLRAIASSFNTCAKVIRLDNEVLA